MQPYSVIMKPVISEKSTNIRENEGKYIFQVRMKATKEDVKKAVKALWDVDVSKVQTSIRRSRIRRRGVHASKPKCFKRAIVTLKNNAKLPLFEEQ